MSYGLAVREIRKSRKMTQHDLAQKLRWTQARVSRIESGRQEPAAGDLEDMLYALGASSSERASVFRVR